jgi:hypothetical protein
VPAENNNVSFRRGPFSFLIDQVQDSLRFYYNLLAVKCHRVWIKFLLRFKIAISDASDEQSDECTEFKQTRAAIYQGKI